MITRVLHKKIFYALLCVFLIGRNMLSSQSVISFDFFNIWTVKQNLKLGELYVKDSLVDNTIIGTTLANIAVGNGQVFSRDDVVRDALRLFSTSSALVSIDILELVTNSKNPKDALQSHIDLTNKTLEQIDVTGKGLYQLAQEYWATSQGCYADKIAGDQLFYQAAGAGDVALTQAWLDQAVDAAPCYITNRIKANAYAFLADKVVTHQALLQQRRDILVNNTDLLLNNTAYLNDDTLAQLVNLKTKLHQVNSTTYEQVNSAFSFNFLNPNAPFPSFKKIRRDPGEEPTFADPWLDRNQNFGFNVW